MNKNRGRKAILLPAPNIAHGNQSLYIGFLHFIHDDLCSIGNKGVWFFVTFSANTQTLDHNLLVL